MRDGKLFIKVFIIDASTFGFCITISFSFQGNDIRLLHYPKQRLHSPGEPYSVRLLESDWVRQDGGRVDREHLLMALAAVQHVLVRANLAEGVEEAG